MVYAKRARDFLCHRYSPDTSWRRGPAYGSCPQDQFHGPSDSAEPSMCFRTARSSIPYMSVACGRAPPDSVGSTPSQTDRRIPSFVPLVQRARCHQTCADQGDPQYLGVDATIWYDSAGREVEKFSGRCLRLTTLSSWRRPVQVALIQLLGGWSSSASTEA